MNPNLSIVQPVLVQVGLTFLLLFWMAKERLAAVQAGDGHSLRSGRAARVGGPGRRHLECVPQPA